MQTITEFLNEKINTAKFAISEYSKFRDKALTDKDFERIEKFNSLIESSSGEIDAYNFVLEFMQGGSPATTDEKKPSIQLSTKANNSCINNAFENEDLFVLRAQDKTSPRIIMEWIKENFESCTEEKLKGAFDIALRMRGFANRKFAD